MESKHPDKSLPRKGSFLIVPAGNDSKKSTVCKFHKMFISFKSA